MGLIPSCGHSGIVGASLSKKLYSHCSSPPSCNINGYLVITGEANVKLLSMSTNGCDPGGTLGTHTITLSMAQPHLRGTSPPRWICQHWLTAPNSCPDTPVPHWVGVTAKQQLELCLACFACVCVCVCLCMCMCTYMFCGAGSKGKVGIHI